MELNIQAIFVAKHLKRKTMPTTSKKKKKLQKKKEKKKRITGFVPILICVINIINLTLILLKRK